MEVNCVIVKVSLQKDRQTYSLLWYISNEIN